MTPSSNVAPARFAARLLALCIVSHHGGLIDCVAPNGREGLHARLGKEERNAHSAEAWRNVSPELREQGEQLMRGPELLAQCLRKIALLRDKERTSGDFDVQLGLFVRMLFSCLIDADRTDTADHENRGAARHRQRGAYEPWDKLLTKLEAGIAKLASGSSVKLVRRQISDECFAAASRVPGIYTLTVPTGGGKTLAALRFALEHARLNSRPGQTGMDRVVFVSPFIIVDQNAAVARRLSKT